MRMSQSIALSSADMASAQLFLLSLVVMAATGAPQFEVDSVQQPTPYDFAYGVNVPDTGDAKEHKESVSPSGRTEGEYRWLQPNGLYLVVRYFVDGDSGFQAEVSEEPGEDITNYYTNSIGQQSTSGAVVASSQGSFAKSIDSTQSTLGAAVNVISAPQPSLIRRPTFRPSPSPSFNVRQQGFGSQEQGFGNQQSLNVRQQGFGSQEQGFGNQQGLNVRQQGFGSQETFSSSQEQSFSNQQSFNVQQESFGNVIDGGIINGGIIDGGIIDGGIIDGGIIDASSIENDSRFQG